MDDDGMGSACHRPNGWWMMNLENNIQFVWIMFFLVVYIIALLFFQLDSLQIALYKIITLKGRTLRPKSGQWMILLLLFSVENKECTYCLNNWSSFNDYLGHRGRILKRLMIIFEDLVRNQNHVFNRNNITTLG